MKSFFILIVFLPLLAAGCDSGLKDTLPPGADTTSFNEGNRQHLLFSSGFEDSNYLKGWQNRQHCCGYSISSSPQSRAGNQSVRFELKRSDPQVSGSVRSEINLEAEPDTRAERWYGVSFFLEEYESDNGSESILQWHHTNHISSGSPPLAIWVNDGKLLLVHQEREGVNSYEDLGAATTGRWIDIVFHIKWTDQADGFIQAWKNGSLAFNKAGIRTNFSPNYVKLGINKWSWAPGGGSSSSTRRVMYADEFRVGNEKARYEDVQPGP